MIEFRIQFDETPFNHLSGARTVEFLTAMLKDDPKFFINAADEITVTGQFGRQTI